MAKVKDVALTKDEEQQALDAALRIKIEAIQIEEKAKEQAELDEKVRQQREQDEAQAAAARKANPQAFVGVEQEPGSVVYYPNVDFAAGRPLARTIVVEGVRLEHTHEDADGVWMFRSL